jgi:hypothetical protein
MIRVVAIFPVEYACNDDDDEEKEAEEKWVLVQIDNATAV